MSVKGLSTPASTAMVISECQNGMTNPAHATNALLAEQVAKRDTITNIAHLAAECRVLGVPVFHVTVQAATGYRCWAVNSVLTGVFRRRPLVEGNVEVAIHPDLTPEPEDFVIARHRGITAFHGTELEHLLHNMGVTTVLMTGVSTNVAINGSCIDGVNRGFNMVVPQECVAGATDETHEFMLEKIIPLVATVASSAGVVAQLAAK